MVRRAMVIGIVAAVVGGGVPRVRAQETAATQASTQPATLQERMEGWWGDLEKGEPAASRAVLKFSETPVETTAFFAERLQPLVISTERLGDLLAQLGSDNEAVWKGAFEQLEYFDPRLTADLELLMDGATDDVLRARLVEVLSDLPAGTLKGKRLALREVGTTESYVFSMGQGSFRAEMDVGRLNSAGGGSPKRTWTRAVRAMAILEHIGGAGALAILQDMATGNAEAQPTKVAKEMVEGMVKGQKSKP